VTFVVKPVASARHRTALIANVNTWNAYNSWGGASKYTGAAITSFKRPNPGATLYLTLGAAPPPFPGTHLAHAEVWVLAALERVLQRGNVDAYTDIDFDVELSSNPIHAGPGSGQYDRLVISTHPEYWTERMYDNLKAFLDQGGDVLYLGGNGLFETVEYAESPTGVPALKFFGGTDGVSEAHRVPWLFRVKGQAGGVPARAERKLLGMGTVRCFADGYQNAAAYVVKPEPPIGTYERVRCGFPRCDLEPRSEDRNRRCARHRESEWARDRQGRVREWRWFRDESGRV